MRVINEGPKNVPLLACNLTFITWKQVKWPQNGRSDLSYIKVHDGFSRFCITESVVTFILLADVSLFEAVTRFKSGRYGMPCLLQAIPTKPSNYTKISRAETFQTMYYLLTLWVMTLPKLLKQSDIRYLSNEKVHSKYIDVAYPKKCQKE